MAKKQSNEMPTLYRTPDRTKVIQLYKKHINSGFARLAEVMGLPVEVSSEKAIVKDERNISYLDCGGYGVFILGHRHPEIIKAVSAQLNKHPMSTRSLVNTDMAFAAESLARVCPGELDQVFFVNSGAEAVELGLKLARLNGRKKIIAMQGSFHGKTIGALSVTHRASFREPFEPLLSGVHFVPYGEIESLENMLSSIAPAEACVILEPVQGEGGVIIPAKGYLSNVEKICKKHDALLIVDEIQTGLGRLGSWWGIEEENVKPDILLVGKGLSGGVIPVSAVVSTLSVFSKLHKNPLLHSSTFAGSPIAMAAAKAAVETIEKENIPQKSKALGQQILTFLLDTYMKKEHPLIKEIRGKGLLIAIEFRKDHWAGDFMLRMLDHKVIVAHSLNTNRVVRLTPPAILTAKEVDWLTEAIFASINQMEKAWAYN